MTDDHEDPPQPDVRPGHVPRDAVVHNIVVWVLFLSLLSFWSLL